MTSAAPSSHPPAPTPYAQAVARAALARQHAARVAHEQGNAELASRIEGLRSCNAALRAQHARLDDLIARLSRRGRR